MVCRKCKLDSDQSRFYFNTTKGKHEHWCIECHREYRRKHYRLNKKAYSTKARRNEQALKERNKLFINSLKGHPCMDCRGSFPSICMDFDHREPELKFKAISKMLGATEAAICKEMAKCDLVCANCHRIRTEKRTKS